LNTQQSLKVSVGRFPRQATPQTLQRASVRVGHLTQTPLHGSLRKQQQSLLALCGSTVVSANPHKSF
jgi:hypothetical protein